MWRWRKQISFRQNDDNDYENSAIIVNETKTMTKIGSSDWN